MARQGKGIQQIAREIGISRNMVRNDLREAGLWRTRRARFQRRHHPAQGIFLAPLKPNRNDAAPLVRFETDPGRRMQVDFTPPFGADTHCAPSRPSSVPDAAAANPFVLRWPAEMANVRVPATLNKRPHCLWQEERAYLQPLPAAPQQLSCGTDGLACATAGVDPALVVGRWETAGSHGMHLQHKHVAPDDAALAPKAATSEASFADSLGQLLAHECALSGEKNRQTLARMACFPGIKTLGEFDFGLASGAPKAQRCSTGCCITPPS